MILADLHNHTSCSHGLASAPEMLEAASKTRLGWFAISEHSPLPPGFHCALYTGNLERDFPCLMRELLRLKKAKPMLLAGLELDWIPSNPAWMREIVEAWPFDHVLGSLHFLDGVSVGNPASWPPSMTFTEQCERFEAWFYEMAAMCASGLVNIVSHPDFIKLRTFENFHKWLLLPEAEKAIEAALSAMSKYGVALEINSAGLRQNFREIYPCSTILRMASKRGIEITFGSDAHQPDHIAADFEAVENIAKQHGFKRYVAFFERKPRHFGF